MVDGTQQEANEILDISPLTFYTAYRNKHESFQHTKAYTESQLLDNQINLAQQNYQDIAQ